MRHHPPGHPGAPAGEDPPRRVGGQADHLRRGIPGSGHRLAPRDRPRAARLLRSRQRLEALPGALPARREQLPRPGPVRPRRMAGPHRLVRPGPAGEDGPGHPGAGGQHQQPLARSTSPGSAPRPAPPPRATWTSWRRPWCPSSTPGTGRFPGPANRGIGGSSYGGLISLYGAWTRPAVFGFVMAMSPAFAFDFHAMVNATPPPRRPLRIYLDSGTVDWGGGDDGMADDPRPPRPARRPGLRSGDRPLPPRRPGGQPQRELLARPAPGGAPAPPAPGDLSPPPPLSCRGGWCR